MVKQHPTDTLILALVVISVVILAVFESYAQPSGKLSPTDYINRKGRNTEMRFEFFTIRNLHL